MDGEAGDVESEGVRPIPSFSRTPPFGSPTPPLGTEKIPIALKGAVTESTLPTIAISATSPSQARHRRRS